MVSAIITTHERNDLLERAIRSVLNQSYEDLECIVVDDNPNGMAEVVVSEFDESNLKYVKHGKNKGASAARNTGIRASNGSLVAFLDDDDEWVPGKVESQVKKIRKSSEDVGLVYCWMKVINQREGEEIKKVSPKLRGDIFKETIDGQPLGNVSTWMVTKKAVKEVGGFDESLVRGDDGDFLRRVARKFEVDYVPSFDVRYFVEHGHSRLTRSNEKGLREAIRAQEVRFEKFREELKSMPIKASHIHARIGYRYSQIGEYKEMSYSYAKSLLKYPFSRRTHSDIKKSALIVLKRAYDKVKSVLSIR